MTRWHAWTLIAALAVAGCTREGPEPSSADAASAGETEARPAATLTGLEDGWNEIAPGGETTCSDGSPYRFFVRPGDPDKLLVYFQGGGACWYPENCDPHLDPSYKIDAADDDPARYDGIFAFDNPENPFRAHSVVLAPYCTADVHLGDNVATYQTPATEEHAAHALTIRHKGHVNASAVLEWVYAHFHAPERIFVTGSSAGAIPSPYYAWQIAERYPDAALAQLGDAAGGYRRNEDTDLGRMERWGTLEVLDRHPEFAEATPETFTYESLYIAAAQRHPDARFAEYDAAEDAVQRRYLDMGRRETERLLPLLEANHADIRAEVDNFSTFVAGGDSHTILGRPEFYTLHVDGTRIRDWVARLARLEAVPDLACEDCSQAQTLDGEPVGGSD